MTDELESKLRTIRNLQDEQQRLLEKTQDLEEKYADLTNRHNTKTDMVGKLSVKTFILMSEIDRLNQLNS